jgi:hypothetical protein
MIVLPSFSRYDFTKLFLPILIPQKMNKDIIADHIYLPIE